MPLDHLAMLIENLQRFDLAAEQEKIIEEHKDVLADLQAEQWGERSVDNMDRSIKLLDNVSGVYRPFTIEKKQREGIGLGSVISRITLFQTGELYKELFTTITNGKFFLSSSVPYFKKLMRRTGDVTGLDYEQRLKFAETYTRPGIRKVLKEKIGITF
jgi:hypothetical protein